MAQNYKFVLRSIVLNERVELLIFYIFNLIQGNATKLYQVIIHLHPFLAV
jgi:hypothetical protein